MFHLIDTLTNKAGDALVGYRVKLRNAAGSFVSIYADENATPIVTVSGEADTAFTDEYGLFSIFVDDGTYDIVFFDKEDANLLLRSIVDVPMYGETLSAVEVQAAEAAALAAQVAAEIARDVTETHKDNAAASAATALAAQEAVEAANTYRTGIAAATLAALNALAGPFSDGDSAAVYADGTAANNGIYAYSGAAWGKVADLPDAAAAASASDAATSAAEIATVLDASAQALINYTGTKKAETVTASLRIVQNINTRTGKATGDIPRQTAFAAVLPKRRAIEQCYDLLRSAMVAGTKVVLVCECQGQSNAASSSGHGPAITTDNRIPGAVTFAGGPQESTGAVVPMASVTKEMPVVGFVEGFYDRLSQEDIPLANLTLFAIGSGKGATKLSSLGPSSTAWDTKLAQYASVKAYADSIGAICLYAGEFLIQGETDANTVSTTQSAYQSALTTRQTQLASAVATYFPDHTAPVNIFLSQTSYAAATSYTDGSVVRNGQVVVAQREVARFSDTIHMVDVTYALAKDWDVDGTHRPSRGHFIEGYRAGYTAARLWAVGEKPHILDCVKATYILTEDGEHFVRAQFNALGALYWNIDDRDLIDFQRISTTSYGFAVVDSSRADVTISDTYIGDDNALWMQLASDPGEGAILRGGLTGLPWDMSIIVNNPNISSGCATNLCCDFAEGARLLDIPVPDGTRQKLRQYSAHFEQTIARGTH